MSRAEAREILERARTDAEFRERLSSTPKGEHIPTLRAEGYHDVEREHLADELDELTAEEAAAASGGGGNPPFSWRELGREFKSLF